MKKIIAMALTVLIALSCLTACGKAPSGPAAGKEIKVGICNYVDDASLNQIVDNIQSRLKEIGEEKGVTFNVSYDNCNADANLMNQIISNFMADGVDIMVGVATPVAMAMLCMAKTSSVSPQPMMNCWKRVNGANHGATAADMSTCRRLITNVVKTMEKTDAPIPHRPTAMNCPAPA